MKICLGVIPAMGGILHSLKLADFFLRKGHDIALVYPDEKFGFNMNEFKKMLPGAIQHVTRPTARPLILPSILLTSRLFKRALQGYDIYQHIGGTFLGADPFYTCNVPYNIWLGTTFREEWDSVFSFSIENKSFQSLIAQSVNQLMLPRILALEKKILEKSSRIYVQSAYTQKIVETELGISTSKVEIMPCFVDLEFIQSVSIDKPDFMQDNAYYLVTVSRFDPRKNIPRLVRLFFEIKKQTRENLKFLIIGQSGPDETLIMNLRRRYRLEKDVLVIKSVSQESKYRILKNATLYLSSSLQEGFGISILEAFACGLPCVIFDSLGPRDFVSTGTNGYILDQREPENFVQTVVDLIEHPESIRRLKKAALETSYRYGLEEIGEKFLKEYEDQKKATD